MTAADRPSVTDDARAEADRRYPIPTDALDFTYPRGALRDYSHAAFIAGAEWAAGRAETTTATTEDAAGIDRAEVRRVLENEFWPFLAHDPHDPDRFWGQAVDSVMGLLATARTRPTETEWGVRSPSGGVTPWGHREISARRHANESGHALVRREVTAWTEADQ